MRGAMASPVHESGELIGSDPRDTTVDVAAVGICRRASSH
jgi:hypothetical protein